MIEWPPPAGRLAFMLLLGREPAPPAAPAPAEEDEGATAAASDAEAALPPVTLAFAVHAVRSECSAACSSAACSSARARRATLGLMGHGTAKMVTTFRESGIG